MRIIKVYCALAFLAAILAAEKDIYDEIIPFPSHQTPEENLAEFIRLSTSWCLLPLLGLLGLLRSSRKVTVFILVWISSLLLLINGFYALNGPSDPVGAGHMHLFLVPPVQWVLCGMLGFVWLICRDFAVLWRKEYGSQ